MSDPDSTPPFSKPQGSHQQPHPSTQTSSSVSGCRLRRPSRRLAGGSTRFVGLPTTRTSITSQHGIQRRSSGSLAVGRSKFLVVDQLVGVVAFAVALQVQILTSRPPIHLVKFGALAPQVLPPSTERYTPLVEPTTRTFEPIGTIATIADVTNGLFAPARPTSSTMHCRPAASRCRRRRPTSRCRRLCKTCSQSRRRRVRRQGISGTSIEHGRAGVEGERSHRERILGVHFRNPRRAAVGRFPYAAVVGRKIKRLIRRSRRIDDDADYLTRDRTDALILLHRVDAQRCRADLLPCRAQRDSFGRRCNAHALRLLHAFDPQVGTHFARCIAANILIASVTMLPQRSLDAVAAFSSRRVHVSLRPC